MARTSIRQAEVRAQRRMIERTQDRFGVWPQRLAADSAYGSAENLAWLVHERGIEPHILVFDKSARENGTFERADFRYDHKHDRYICPGGNELRQYWQESRAAKAKLPSDGLYRYRARKADCGDCVLKTRCCPKRSGAKGAAVGT